VRSLSYAEAFDIDGAPLSGLTAEPLPSEYGANAPAADYDFVLSVPGQTITKSIVGHVVDADVVNPGTKDSQYALYASNFQVNTTVAATITTNALFISEAQATVVKLVASAPDRGIRLDSTGGFTNVQSPTLDDYPIGFSLDIDPLDTLNAQSIAIVGYVTDGDAPIISLHTPLEVWIGADADKPNGALLPSEYTGLNLVIAEDAEDDDITDLVQFEAAPGSPAVDLTSVGVYKLIYTVIDSDLNQAEPKERLVVVNDGRYIVTDNDGGRVLYAAPFVTRLLDVTSDVSQISAELLAKSAAALYDGETGNAVDALSISDTNGYTKAVGIYDVVVSGADAPTGTLSKSIKAQVVDADEIDNGQGDDDPDTDPDPSTPQDPNKDTTYVFGNNVELLPSEALALLNGDGTVDDDAVLSKLRAAAIKASPAGALNDVSVKVVKWIDDKTLANKDIDTVKGIYKLVVADIFNQADIVLTINVVAGNAPEISNPKPIVIPVSDDATALDRAAILNGTDADGAEWHVVASDFEDGDLTDVIVITETDVTSVFPTIPGNAPGIYPVTFTVTDGDGNQAESKVAVVIDDGSYQIDPDYILSAYSFLIGLSEVSTTIPNTQILNLSGAQAAQTDGTPAAAYLVESAGYRAEVGEYHPTIGIIGYPSMTRTITAKVFDDTDTIGVNGDAYAITGDSFRINIADANLLVGGTLDAIADEFYKRGHIKSYLRTDINLPEAGTQALTSDGGFKDHGTFSDTDDGATFDVTFWVNEDHTAEVTITVLVSNGASPSLSVLPWKEIGLNGVFGAEQYLYGVQYSDGEDTPDKLALTYTEPVDTSVPGIYEVTYTVTDTDGNQTSAVGRVLVNDGNWVVGNDYLIYAHNFSLDYEAALGTHDEILALSEALALSKDTLTPVEVVVVNDGNYTKYPGSYGSIQLAPAPEQTAIRSVRGIITGGEYRVVFDPNGGHLVGPEFVRLIGSGSTLPFLPQNPVRDGYTFVSWNTARDGLGTNFVASTPVTANVTIYAQWEPVPVVETPPPTPPNVINVINPPITTVVVPPSASTYVTVTPASDTPIVNVGPDHTPIAQIGDNETPTANVLTETVWALLDLIFALASLALLIFYVVKFFIERKEDKAKEKEQEENPGTWKASSTQRIVHVSLPVLILAIVGVIEAAIILLATQDFTAKMAMVDDYTVIFAVISFVLLIVPIISALRQNQKDILEYQELQYQQRLLQLQQQQQPQFSQGYTGPTL
jgi:uncharacterized repeat protein (TIGR02543 family)